MMKVLIADDDPICRRVLKSWMDKWGYEAVLASNGEEVLTEVSHEDHPQLIILDWMMPGMDGPEVCRKIREAQNDRYIYIIMLTTKKLKEEVVEGLEAGADDYVSKPFDLSELKMRILSGARILNLETRLLEAQRELEILATHDSLTGILNHRAIMNILDKELSRCNREGQDLGIIMADVDHFKNINDTYGHLSGDRVLKEVSRRITISLRPYDSVGRYGGEEFMMVLPSCSLEETRNVANRVAENIRSSGVKISKGTIFLTISQGIISTNNMGEKDAVSLIRLADKALYRAKEEGRNRISAAEC